MLSAFLAAGDDGWGGGYACICHVCHGLNTPRMIYGVVLSLRFRGCHCWLCLGHACPCIVCFAPFDVGMSLLLLLACFPGLRAGATAGRGQPPASLSFYFVLCCVDFKGPRRRLPLNRWRRRRKRGLSLTTTWRRGGQ